MNRSTGNCFLWLIIALFPLIGLAEGTKEIMPDSTKPARILPAQGNVSGQQRDPFAVFNGAADYRLFVHVKDSLNEKIYFGIGSIVSGGGPVTWRIHRPDGTVIFSATTPTTGQGFIANYAKAIAGPNGINPAGYPADSVVPDVSGDYFMTFQIGNNSSREFSYFDITVINTLTNTVIPGRVFSKNWQIRNPQVAGNWIHYYGLMYVYSKDSIITKLNPDGFDGRDFSFACNESGCYPVGPLMPANQARKSVEGRHTYPEYRIFLNDPDSLVYPSGTLGVLVQNSPVVQPISECNTGEIKFAFEVTGTGSAQVFLQLSALGVPYVDRLLVNSVTAGWDTVVWDGYDGAVPAHLVPNNSSFPFTFTYINGMTHLPLYDVENNPSGFIVTLIRPVGPEPNFYWDDTALNPFPAMTPGPLLSPPGGCVSSLSPCHVWSGNDPGNLRSINTWWYVSNTSTAPVTITLLRSPSMPGPVTGPSSVCPGSSGHIYWVNSSLEATSHTWGYTGTGETITNIDDTTITVSFASNATSGNLTVSGTNPQCGAGPSRTYAITVTPPPLVTLSAWAPVCISVAPFTLTGGTPAGGTYTIAGIPYTIFDPALQGTGTHTVTYTYIDPITTCTGDTTRDIIVNPLPVVTMSPLAGICISAPSFTLTGGTPLGGTYSGTGVAGGIFNPSVAGAGTFKILYTFTDLNGCTNKDSTNITVFPLPVITFNPLPPVCINIPPFPLSGGNPAGGTYSGAGVTAGSFDPAAAGVGIHPIRYTYTNANGCTDSTSQNITVNPLPGAAGAVSGPATVCQASAGILFTTTAIPNAASYSWSIVPAVAGTITGTTTTGSVNWSAAFTGSASIFVKGVNNCGNGVISSGYQVTVNPRPVVSYTICTDSITTLDAAPFRLKGGIPLGGAYSGPGVNNPSAGFFNPAAAGLGTKAIRYTYINTYGCSSFITKNIVVSNTILLVCGNNFTDVRNNKSYQTVKIGSQCWMAENLNYGTNILSTSSQEDNCVVEKYCYNNAPANCNVNGGLYQWDELMTYDATEDIQGLCPPGWHIPSETEWNVLFNFYTNNGFAGSDLKITGFSGFNALLAGASFHNITHNFMNFAGFFWSSTIDGPNKAWAHAMNTPDPSVALYPNSRSNAYYVRCLKN